MEGSDENNTRAEAEFHNELLLPETERTKRIRTTTGKEDDYLEVLGAIEGAISHCYRRNPRLRDIDFIRGLRNQSRDLTLKYERKRYPIEYEIHRRLATCLAFKHVQNMSC